jgi:uncharacterized protein (TIGR02246 family)
MQSCVDADAIKQPIFDFVAAWAEGSGDKLARCFTDDAYFVAFDGTRLTGGAAIGAWHQPAFDRWLRGTTLDVRIDDVRLLAPDLALVASTGGALDRRGSPRSRRVGTSHEVNVVKKLASGEWKLAALQVTRRRPIHGFVNALIWQAFNWFWVTLVRA